MAQISPGMTLRQLVWMSDCYLREETYQKALAEIINFQHKIPFAKSWGEGKTSSSDGQHFLISTRRGHTADTNARYGNAPSVLFYTHISDQYAPFYTKVIASTVRDATYVLDGLLYHQTDLHIEEHYTDTAGYTDHVFALCHLLGFRFAPRIRDLADKRLYTAVERVLDRGSPATSLQIDETRHVAGSGAADLYLLTPPRQSPAQLACRAAPWPL